MAVTTATGGAEALAGLPQDSDYDLAILDLHMPDMDGLTLAQQLRQHPQWGDRPLMLLSSVGGVAREMVDHLKLAAVLSKPAKASQFCDTLINLFADRPPVVRPQIAAPIFDRTLGQRHPLKILLAEDNTVNQKVALRMLDRLGYRADVAGNGIEVLEALERQPYDLVLMDVQMPEMDGLEATRQIQARWPQERRPHIIAMTAHALEEVRQMCLDLGMVGYISKPIRIEELVETLQNEAFRPADNRK
jgi:CheY-like chemotaxis protein